MSVKYPFKLYPLPWAKDALEPFLSERAITLHYDGHHAEYVNEMNSLAQQYPELQSLLLTDIVDRYTGRIRDIAAQVINHNFFWTVLAPPLNSSTARNSGTERNKNTIITSQSGPDGRVYDLIVKQFGSFENFQRQFTQRAIDLFGSGWVWLVYDPQTNFLLVVDGKDAYNPIMDGRIPLLTLDVWEHSYYPDYAYDRKTYVENFWGFINWERVNLLAAEEIFGNSLAMSPTT